jgi:hypothetical protein
MRPAMKYLIPVLLAAALVHSGVVAQESYDRWFTDATLRVDFFHTGTKGEESFSLDACRREGPWPGHRINLVDPLNLGEYLLKVFDNTTNQLLYSRGYSTLFNEWQTTEEALRGIHRTFSESVRMPYPRHAVQITLSRRDRRMEFHEVYSAIIDPADPVQIRKEQTIRKFPVALVVENGKPSDKVDVLVLGDGYTSAEMGKFRKDVDEFAATLLSTEPFKSRKSDFNIWRIDVVSPESGIDIPDKDIWKNNPLGTHYNTFGSARYVLSEGGSSTCTRRPTPMSS